MSDFPLLFGFARDGLSFSEVCFGEKLSQKVCSGLPLPSLDQACV